MTNMTIAPTMTTGPFMAQGGDGESNLSVNSQEVTVGTCFQCEIIVVSDGVPTPFRSMPGCVTSVGV